MDRSIVPPAVFGAVVFALGMAGVLFPYAVRSAFLKLTGGKHQLFSGQTIPSIRFAGVVGILMAIIILWAALRGR